jgi:peptidoglycan/xylan/chitin deacetylase (PgdA/CDA1 family)
VKRAVVLLVLVALALGGVVAGRTVWARKARSGLAAHLPPVPPPHSPTTPSLATDAARIPRAKGLGLEVPILLYHRVGDPNPRWKLRPVSTTRFAEQMRAIADSGVASLTIDEVAEAVRDGRDFPNGAVAISFDDALADQYWNAFPILRQYGLHATFYIPAARVGRDGYLTWDQLREMEATGLVSVAAHTLSHRNLTALSRDDAWTEIAGSRALLEERLGHEVKQFAYPFGLYDARVEQLVADAGFETATTTEHRVVHRPEDALHWGRVEVYEGTSPRALAAMARRAGEWRTPPPFVVRHRRGPVAGPSPTPLASPAPTPTEAEPTPGDAEPCPGPVPGPVAPTLPPCPEDGG